MEKPTSPDDAFTLCDPQRAVEWAARAGRFGKSFRIALPTYGYRLAFDAKGKFFGLSADGPQPAWPAGTQVRVLRTEPVPIARLAQSLRQNPPAHCAGLIWFRLPVAGDRLNWDITTLTTILRGEIPASKLDAQVVWTEPGLAEISIVNSGATTEPLSTASVSLAWPAGKNLFTSDGLNGFRLDVAPTRNEAHIIAAALPPDAGIAPGRSVKIAWLRFAHELPLQAQLAPAP